MTLARYAIPVAALAALTLAACGGGGGRFDDDRANPGRPSAIARADRTGRPEPGAARRQSGGGGGSAIRRRFRGFEHRGRDLVVERRLAPRHHGSRHRHVLRRTIAHGRRTRGQVRSFHRLQRRDRPSKQEDFSLRRLLARRMAKAWRGILPRPLHADRVGRHQHNFYFLGRLFRQRSDRLAGGRQVDAHRSFAQDDGVGRVRRWAGVRRVAVQSAHRRNRLLPGACQRALHQPRRRGDRHGCRRLHGRRRLTADFGRDSFEGCVGCDSDLPLTTTSDEAGFRTGFRIRLPTAAFDSAASSGAAG